jgi:hypothetical protein
MHLGHLAHALQRVRAFAAAKLALKATGTRRDHALGLAPWPRLELGLEGIAVRAAVPEELDHLDLAGGRVGGHGLAQRV